MSKENNLTKGVRIIAAAFAAGGGGGVIQQYPGEGVVQIQQYQGPGSVIDNFPFFLPNEEDNPRPEQQEEERPFLLYGASFEDVKQVQGLMRPLSAESMLVAQNQDGLFYIALRDEDGNSGYLLHGDGRLYQIELSADDKLGFVQVNGEVMPFVERVRGANETSGIRILSQPDPEGKINEQHLSGEINLLPSIEVRTNLQAEVQTDILNLRAGPGTDREDIGDLLVGTQVIVLNQINNDWLHVLAQTTSGEIKEGYVAGGFVNNYEAPQNIQLQVVWAELGIDLEVTPTAVAQVSPGSEGAINQANISSENQVASADLFFGELAALPYTISSDVELGENGRFTSVLEFEDLNKNHWTIGIHESLWGNVRIENFDRDAFMVHLERAGVVLNQDVEVLFMGLLEYEEHPERYPQEIIYEYKFEGRTRASIVLASEERAGKKIFRVFWSAPFVSVFSEPERTRQLSIGLTYYTILSLFADYYGYHGNTNLRGWAGRLFSADQDMDKDFVWERGGEVDMLQDIMVSQNGVLQDALIPINERRRERGEPEFVPVDFSKNR